MRLYSNDSHWNGNTTVAYCLGHLVIMRRTHLGLQSPPSLAPLPLHVASGAVVSHHLLRQDQDPSHDT